MENSTQQIANKIRDIRRKKGISARKMSLELGQSPAYMNRIELGKMTPSLSAFLRICDFLDTLPQSVFDTEESDDIEKLLLSLSKEQRLSIINIIKQMKK